MVDRTDRRRGTRRGLAPDEAALWRAVTEQITPLRRRPAATPMPVPVPQENPSATPEKPAPPSPSRSAAADLAAKLASAPPPAEWMAAPHLSSATTESRRHMAGVDKRTAQRLRRGQLPLQDTLDLHGHTQEEAYRALRQFILANSAAGHRCVLVITGKGRRGQGLLRDNVPHWLSDPALSRHVIAHCPAQPKHGGSGARYALLRRQR